MSVWRRRVLALLPEERYYIQRPGYSIYSALFELLPAVRSAHVANDIDRLRGIYGFAECCSEQRAKELWNAAGVAFYEHLFDSHRSYWVEVVRWLSPWVVEAH